MAITKQPLGALPPVVSERSRKGKVTFADELFLGLVLVHEDLPEDLSVDLVVLAHGAEAEVFAEVSDLLLGDRLIKEGRHPAHHGRQVLYQGQVRVRSEE